MKAYHDFKTKLASISLSGEEQEMIILNITLFSESKYLLKSRVHKLLPRLTDQDEYTLKSIFKYMDLKKKYKNAALYLHDEFNEHALVQLYDDFLNKLATTVYNVFYAKQADELHAGRKSFLALSAEEKCVFLSEFLHLFQCQSALADLHACGGSKNAGRIQLRMNISDYSNLYIVNQSVTGFFQERIKLS